MTSLRAEKRQPLIAAAFAGALAAWYLHGNPVPKLMPQVLGAFVSTSGILAGFIGTTLTILLSLKNSRIYRQLVKNGYGSLIVEYVLKGFYASLGLAIMSGAGLLCDFAITKPENKFFTIAWIALLAYAGVAFIRIIRVLAAILPAEE